MKDGYSFDVDKGSGGASLQESFDQLFADV